MNATVNIDGKNYSIDIKAAIRAGCAKCLHEPEPGDVFVKTTKTCNSFLLVQVIYGTAGPYYQLLGMGCRPNSNEFFLKLHTLEEIKGYLEDNKMVFSRNITKEVVQLVAESKQKQ